MSRQGLDLFGNRLDWLPRLDVVPRPNGKPNRPLSAIIVGGRPEYGNVRKLPAMLWDDFGIAVVAHVTSRPSESRVIGDLDVAIALVDQVSHNLSDWAKSAAVRCVYAPSSASRIRDGLAGVGILPHAGRNFMPRTPEPAPIPEAPPGPPMPTAKPHAQKPEAPAEPKGLSADMVRLIRQIKAQMATDSVAWLELELDGEDLSVQHRRIVVTQGMDVL